MEKIIKLKEPKGGFKIDDDFAKKLGERLSKKKPNIKPDIGLIISEAISLFLETYEIKSKIIT